MMHIWISSLLAAGGLVTAPATVEPSEARYLAGAPELLMQVCRPFFAGQAMRPVLQQLQAWPAHKPLQMRVLGEREGQVYLTRQFGYGLYAVILERDGRCGVQVFDVALNGTEGRSAPVAPVPANLSSAARPATFTLRGAKLDFSNTLQDRGDGRGSMTLMISRPTWAA
jgi:hypothetical protein